MARELRVALVLVGAVCALAACSSTSSDAGASWKSVAVPAPGMWLQDVSADSASDAWAAAQNHGPGGALLHWDGTAWKRVAQPQLDGRPLSPDDVDALSPRDVWVLGDRLHGRDDPHAH